MTLCAANVWVMYNLSKLDSQLTIHLQHKVSMQNLTGVKAPRTCSGVEVGWGARTNRAFEASVSL